MKLTELYRDLRPDLSSIEKKLEKAVKAENSDLRKASFHLLKAGGKRIRPVFVLLSGKFGDDKTDDTKKVAVALELIHMASLVHDDVIDEADLRRGRVTIKSKWDNRVAMYTGDFMFAQALEQVTEIENNPFHRILSDAIVEMCIGEIEQIRDLYEWNQNLRRYLRRIKRKTALLIAVSCQLGAIAAGVDEKTAMSLYRFGYFVGMSYQITDDVLDFLGTEKQLGKPAGSDLRHGNVTLPVLYTLCKEQHRNVIMSFLENPSAMDENWENVLQHVKSSGGIEYSQQLSERYLNKAFHELNSLPDIRARQALLEVARYIGKRKY